MTAHLFAISFDASEPLRLAQFWSGSWAGSSPTIPTTASCSCPRDDNGFRIRFAAEPAAEGRPEPDALRPDQQSLEDQRQTVARALELGARTPTSASARKRITWCSPTPRATSSASSSRATGSLPAAASSARWPATVRRTSATSGARRWAGRWSGTRTRRPRSSRRAAARSSPGVARHRCRDGPGSGAFRHRSACRRRPAGRGRPSALARRDPRRRRPGWGRPSRAGRPRRSGVQPPDVPLAGAHDVHAAAGWTTAAPVGQSDPP